MHGVLSRWSYLRTKSESFGSLQVGSNNREYACNVDSRINFRPDFLLLHCPSLPLTNAPSRTCTPTSCSSSCFIVPFIMWFTRRKGPQARTKSSCIASQSERGNLVSDPVNKVLVRGPRVNARDTTMTALTSGILGSSPKDVQNSKVGSHEKLHFSLGFL